MMGGERQCFAGFAEFVQGLQNEHLAGGIQPGRRFIQQNQGIVRQEDTGQA